MSDFQHRSNANLGNFASQLHIDPSLAPPRPAANLDPAAIVASMARRAAAVPPGLATDLFGHYAEAPKQPTLNERLEPYINPDGIAIPGTGGNGRFMPITPYNEPEAPGPKQP